MKQNKYIAMITQHQWMFLSSYIGIREAALHKRIINMAHLGARAFDEISGEVVQTSAFVICSSFQDEYLCSFSRLVNYSGEKNKAKEFLNHKNCFFSTTSGLKKLPDFPIVYWISPSMQKLFDHTPSGDVVALREGIHTGDNERFLRFWYEEVFSEIVFNAKNENDVDALGKWVVYNKGGTFRKWYGNNDLIIGFNKKFRDEMNALSGHVRPSQSLYFKAGGTWSALASGKFGLRYYPEGQLFDSKGQVAVGDLSTEIIALFNTKPYQIMADMLMPTLDYKCGDVKKLPYCPIKNSEPISKVLALVC